MQIINKANIKKEKRTSFPFQPKVLNFKEKIGISDINKKDITTVNTINKYGFKIRLAKGLLKFAPIIKGKEQIKIEFAGVFTPIKDSDCRVSLLNLAKRMPENTGIKNAK